MDMITQLCMALLIVVGLMTYPTYLLLKWLGDTHGTKS